MSKIYLADKECKINASEALKEIDKQYLGWGWNTEQTTLDLVEYTKDLQRQLAEAREEVSILVGRFKTLADVCEHEGVRKYAKLTLDNHDFRTKEKGDE